MPKVGIAQTVTFKRSARYTMKKHALQIMAAVLSVCICSSCSKANTIIFKGENKAWRSVLTVYPDEKNPYAQDELKARLMVNYVGEQKPFKTAKSISVTFGYKTPAISLSSERNYTPPFSENEFTISYWVDSAMLNTAEVPITVSIVIDDTASDTITLTNSNGFSGLKG